MAKKALKHNAICEECKAPFHTHYPRHTKCCSTPCRMAHFKKIKAERDKS